MTLFFSSLQEHMFYLIIKKEGVVALDVFEKLKILSDAAKYDASCTSSGVNRKAGRGQIGSAAAVEFVTVFLVMDGVYHYLKY